MPVHLDLNKLPSFRNAVITIGTFDGVHLGHKILIQQIKEEAKRYNGESVVITFEPHPRSVIRPEDTTLRLLTTAEEKTSLIAQEGIQHIVIAPFTKEFSLLSAHEYIDQFLVKRFKPKKIVIGYNHQFGHHRDGNIELLNKYAVTYGYEVMEIHKQLVNDIEVSSTRIRIALTEGDVKKATELLGRPYSFSGTVVKGSQRGRTIGFPTANIQINHSLKLIPARGVYAVRVRLHDKEYSGMMNIGIRPTIEGTFETIEVHLFNFDADIYGDTLEVKCIQRIRNEIKFTSLQELQTQLHRDKQMALVELS